MLNEATTPSTANETKMAIAIGRWVGLITKLARMKSKERETK